MDHGEVIPPKLERILAFYNPASQHAAEAVNYIDELTTGLRDNCVQVVRLSTELDSVANVEKIERHLTERDAVAVLGGDGAAACVLKGMLDLRKPNPTAVLLGGNANDLAHMLHPNRQLKSPSRIFRESRLASLRPLEIITTMPGGEMETNYGFANWTLGGSALAGTYFADKDRRVGMTAAEAKPFGKLRRLGLEYKLSIQALKEVDTVALEGDLCTDRLLDLSVSNGPRMAKLFHFHDLELLRPEAGLIVSERRSEVHIDLSKFIAKSLMGSMTRIKPATIISFAAYSRHGGNLVVQNDGEAQTVPSGSNFTLSLADRSVPVYTTRD